jgi:hypothetical protein
MHINSVLASIAVMSLAAAPRPEIDASDDERKTTAPPPPPEPCENLPGETNRQFAARMKAAADEPKGTSHD